MLEIKLDKQFKKDIKRASFSKKQTHRHFHPKENRQYSPFVKNATKKRLYG
jgi:mRNA-degrading endonuclease YafQ of YafQ-DinJ toxin-antitoxin module